MYIDSERTRIAAQVFTACEMTFVSSRRAVGLVRTIG